MGYIKVKHRAMLQEMDNRNYLPSKWQDFIDQKAIAHNLIIKTKEGCICTNCKHSFFSKKKIKEKVNCPNCKQSYLIKRSNLKKYVFADDLLILDKVDNVFMARLFELRSDYNNNSKYYGFDRSTVEYARFIPETYSNEATFVNERVSKNTGPIHIYHRWGSATAWRGFTRYYGINKSALVYPYNLKSLLKDTENKYSMIWELVKHVDYVSIEDLLKHSRYSQKIEMLTKAKLYNLALESEKFYDIGNFEIRFGVPQNFYPFMKRHNITYDELERLRILKEPNIKDIRYLLSYTKDQLTDISAYVKIKDFVKYVKSKRGKVDAWIYRDYLKFAYILGFDLKNKKYAFPKNLNEEHDRLSKQVDIGNKKVLNKAITRRLKELSQNTYKNKTYIIFPAKSVSALEDESKQQGNCVRNYSEDYACRKM